MDEKVLAKYIVHGVFDSKIAISKIDTDKLIQCILEEVKKYMLKDDDDNCNIPFNEPTYVIFKTTHGTFIKLYNMFGCKIIEAQLKPMFRLIRIDNFISPPF